MVETLTEQIKIVAINISNSVKTGQIKTAKNLELDIFENLWIF